MDLHYTFGHQDASIWLTSLKMKCSLDVSFQMALERTQLDSYGLSYGLNNAHCSGTVTAPIDFTSRSNLGSKTWELASELVMKVVGLPLNFPKNKKSLSNEV